MYTKETRLKAKALYTETGLSIREVSKRLNIPEGTLFSWSRNEKWQKEMEQILENKSAIHKQISHLSNGNMTEQKARKIAMLTKALARLERVENSRKKKVTARPKARMAYIGGIQESIDAYIKRTLRPYQIAFLKDDSRFRIMLKARQVGISWLMALEMIRNAMIRDVDQNLVSTSMYQAENTIRYVREHLRNLQMTDSSGNKTEVRLPNQRYIRVIPSTICTSQGWPGDVFYDEFAWYRNAHDVYTAITPSITSVGGRITIVSTPYEAGPQNMFWRIQTNDGNEFPLYSKHEINIHKAVKEGLSIDVKELKSLFDKDTWERIYECKYFTDEDSFFTLSEINNCRGVCLAKKPGDWKGYDRRAGWDMAKTTDASEVVAIEKLTNQVFIRGIETWRRLPYVEQGRRLVSAVKKWDIKKIHIDQTGVGHAVQEIVSPLIPETTQQHWHNFTQEFKAGIAQNMKKLVEEERLVIPHDDRILVSQFLSVKRIPTKKGISYDIARNAHGHGDRFWALALACYGVAFGNANINVEAW